MDYLPILIGLRIGSQEFKDAIKQLQTELVEKAELSPEDSLTITYGKLAELKTSGEKHAELLEPIYDEEHVLLIGKASDKSLLYVKRVIEIDPTNKTSAEKMLLADNVVPSGKLNYVLPRYEGTNFLYYALVTLERYIGRNKAIYHPNFKRMKDENPRDIRHSIKLIREAFNEQHYDGDSQKDAKDTRIKFTDIDMEQKYEEMTQLMARVVYIRSNPLYDKELETVIKEAFEPIKVYPEALNNPNQITELFLRMSVLAVSAIIDDMKRYESRNPYLYSEKINETAKEMSLIYEKIIMELDYEPEKDRYSLGIRAAKSFEKMYKEATGDLFKIACACANIGRVKPDQVDNSVKVDLENDDKDTQREKNAIKYAKFWEHTLQKREDWATLKLLANRADKIGQCLKSQEEIKKTVSVSARINSGLQAGELPNLLNQLFYWGRQTVGTSASDIQRYTHANHYYSRYHALVEDEAEIMKSKGNLKSLMIGRGLDILSRELDGVVDSKRRSNSAVREVQNALIDDLKHTSRDIEL